VEASSATLPTNKHSTFFLTIQALLHI
jgi:hypothetical protein